jgi:hypothetical protein
MPGTAKCGKPTKEKLFMSSVGTKVVTCDPERERGRERGGEREETEKFWLRCAVPCVGAHAGAGEGVALHCLGILVDTPRFAADIKNNIYV